MSSPRWRVLQRARRVRVDHKTGVVRLRKVGPTAELLTFACPKNGRI